MELTFENVWEFETWCFAMGWRNMLFSSADTYDWFPSGRSSKKGDSCVCISDLRCSVLQRVAVCCSVLQCVAVCCSVLPCVAVCCSVLRIRLVPFRQVIKKEQLLCICQWPALQCVAVCCIFFAVCCNVSACCSVLHIRLVPFPQVVDKGRLLCIYR